jgi:hypothetical protein
MRRHAGATCSQSVECAAREVLAKASWRKVRPALRRQARCSARSTSICRISTAARAPETASALIRRSRHVGRAAEGLLHGIQPPRQAGNSAGVKCRNREASSKVDASYAHIGFTLAPFIPSKRMWVLRRGEQLPKSAASYNLPKRLARTSACHELPCGTARTKETCH